MQAPYILYVEVLEVEDIHTSPVPAKIMNTLRHTKSEENLVAERSNTNEHPHPFPTYKMDEESGDCWSQEDDEISLQVILIKTFTNIELFFLSVLKML